MLECFALKKNGYRLSGCLSLKMFGWLPKGLMSLQAPTSKTCISFCESQTPFIELTCFHYQWVWWSLICWYMLISWCQGQTPSSTTIFGESWFQGWLFQGVPTTRVGGGKMYRCRGSQFRLGTVYHQLGWFQRTPQWIVHVTLALGSHWVY